MRTSRYFVSLRTYALAFAIVLSPALMRGYGGGGSYYTCVRSSNTELAELAFLVDGEDQITFAADQLLYDVWLPVSADIALGRAVPVDPSTSVFFRVSNDFDSFDVGGTEAAIPLVPGLNRIELHIIAEDRTTRNDYVIYTRVGCSDCSDWNECTMDECDPVVEVCSGHTPLTVGAPCDVGDGVPGVCRWPSSYGQPIYCASACTSIDCVDDFNDCTSNACDPWTGACTVVADGTPCAGGTCVSGACNLTDTLLPCTEQGVRNAIAAGGGPYTFDCAGPTTIGTTLEIDNDVVLDAEGNLTLLGFTVTTGIIAELRGFTFDGAIFNSGTLTLVDTFCTGISNGGTMSVIDTSCTGISNGGTMSLETTTVSGHAGHGVYNSGTMSLQTSTVSGHAGHGVYNSGTLTMTNSTVSGNTLYGIYGAAGTMTVTNSTISGSGLSAIFADGRAAASASLDIAGTLIDGHCAPWEDPVWISNGHNIESPANTCAFDQATDRFDVTAAALNLGPLQNNGGPTETHALLPGSVAIDGIPEQDCVDADGAPLTTDQRGVVRPQGIDCDVGAFELELTP